MNFPDYLLLVIQYTEDRAMCLRDQSALFSMFCAEVKPEQAGKDLLYMSSKPGEPDSI